MSNKILVLGGTGTIGSKVVAGLIARGAAVRVASRKGADAAIAGAETVRFDYSDPSTFAAALDGVGGLFAVVPAGQLDPHGLLMPVLQAAAARGVKLVVQTVIGADADPSSPYGRIEAFLKQSGTPFVILRPNWFTDNFLTYWGAGIKAGVIAVPAGDGKTSFIDTRDIAASAVTALTTSAFDGQAFNLTGAEALGYGDAAAIIAKAIGKPVAYLPVTGAAFVDSLVGHGVPRPYAEFLAFIFTFVAAGYTAGITDAVETLTGRKPIPVADWVEANKAALAG